MRRKFPLIALNLHRYFFYGALVFGLLNVYDGIQAFHGKDGGFGIGLGTVIIWINLVMLWLYTLSCHACRHIVGGRLKNFSKHPLRYRYWTFVSKLNPKHGTFAMSVAVHRDPHRRLHHGAVGRLVLRPALLQLIRH